LLEEKEAKANNTDYAL